MTDFGTFESNDYFDLHNAKTIFLWGKNVSVSNIHLIPELKKARDNGTRVVLIDPIHHQTTSVSDCYVQPRPGGDAAIALGIAACLLESGGWDPGASGYCDYHDEFQQLVRSRTPREWARAADITLDRNRAPAYVDVDAPLLEQALHGLLANALEASPPGASLQVATRVDHDRATLTICDAGPGMAVVPDPQASAPLPTTKRRGTGLGIPFAYKVIHAHDGELNYDSAPGGGTRVRVRLPGGEHA